MVMVPVQIGRGTTTPDVMIPRRSADETMKPLVLGLLCAWVLVIDVTSVLAQETYCSRWNRAAGKPELQRYAMSENVKKLDGTRVSHACLLRQIDALVRWANRMCSDGRLDQEAFAHVFVDEARKRCP